MTKRIVATLDRVEKGLAELRALVLSSEPDHEFDKLDQILADTSESSGISVKDIKSKGRTRMVSVARSEFCLAAAREGFSLLEIGDRISRNHTTALYLIKKAERAEAGDA